jgi:PAS domain S-box-containing protein
MGTGTNHPGAETKDLNNILQGSPIPTFVVNSDCKITYWNRACELLTGIRGEDIIDTDKHREAFYSEPRQVMADLIVKHAGPHELTKHYGNKYKRSQIIQDGYEGENFFPRLGPKGKWLFFTVAPLKDTDGNIIGAIETIQDITERQMAEQALINSEARYRQLFECANDAIFILKDEIISSCNRKATDLFSRALTDIAGLSLIELSPGIQPDGRSSEVEMGKKFSIVMRDVPQFFEWSFLKRDGSLLNTEISLTRFKIFDSPYALAIVRDITDRKKTIKLLQVREGELEEKSRYLEKVNQALKSTLEYREVEKRAVEESILVNLKRLVFPYIEELGKCKVNTDARTYVNIIRTNLNDITSQFSKTISAKYIGFTPTEIRIADFIREGKNIKATAELLGLSPTSVKWHRKNIREKLGLTNKKINLQNYLNSLAR